MSLAIALRQDGETWVGVDSIAIGAGGYQRTVRGAGEKLFRMHDMLIGCIGSFRTAQALRYHAALEPFSGETAEDFTSYLVREFVPKLREALNGAGVDTRAQADDLDNGCSLVVAHALGVFGVYCDYSVLSFTEDYVVEGAGVGPALGALYATASLNGPKLHPKERVYLAMGAGALYTGSVQSPFHIEKL